jgi:hypothetical protein
LAETPGVYEWFFAIEIPLFFARICHGSNIICVVMFFIGLILLRMHLDISDKVPEYGMDQIARLSSWDKNFKGKVSSFSKTRKDLFMLYERVYQSKFDIEDYLRFWKSRSTYSTKSRKMSLLFEKWEKILQNIDESLEKIVKLIRITSNKN